MTCLKKERMLIEIYCFWRRCAFCRDWMVRLAKKAYKNYSSCSVISSDFFRYILRNNDLRGHYCLLLGRARTKP